MGVRHFLRRPLRQALEILADRGQIEPAFSGKVGNAEAAAEIEEAYRRRGIGRQSERQFVRFLLSLADRFGPQVLRTGKEMKTFESQPGPSDLAQQFGNTVRRQRRTASVRRPSSFRSP